MIDFKSIDEITRKLGSALPPAMGNLRSDMEQQFRAILQGAFERMDLVTREEFDVQQAVLAKTREKLESLEQAVRQLESERKAAGD